MIQATNNFTLTGNLTKDPEPKKTANGKKYCFITLAVNGFSKDEVNFLSIIAWEKMAENLVKYCKKGDSISVIGSISAIKKEEKTALQLTAEQITFLHKSAKNSGSAVVPEKKEEPEETFEAAPADPFATW